MWNAICLDIGEKIGRLLDPIRLLKKLREASTVSYEQDKWYDQLWTTFYAGLIAVVLLSYGTYVGVLISP